MATNIAPTTLNGSPKKNVKIEQISTKPKKYNKKRKERILPIL